MTSYLVKWEANVHADTPREAAEKGLALLRAGGRNHQIFTVIVSGGQSSDLAVAARAFAAAERRDEPAAAGVPFAADGSLSLLRGGQLDVLRH